MRITFKNLGAIRQADLTLGDLTVICGKNNTGKTYVTYATYGFMDFWHKDLSVNIPADLITEVMEKGSISVSANYSPRMQIKFLREHLLNTLSTLMMCLLGKNLCSKMSISL